MCELQMQKNLFSKIKHGEPNLEDLLIHIMCWNSFADKKWTKVFELDKSILKLSMTVQLLGNMYFLHDQSIYKLLETSGNFSLERTSLALKNPITSASRFCTAKVSPGQFAVVGNQQTEIVNVLTGQTSLLLPPPFKKVSHKPILHHH